MKQDILDRTFRNYKNSTNMSYTELLIWSKKPISKLYKSNKEPIRRTLRLLKKNKNKWTSKDIKDANLSIQYIKKAKKQPRGKLITKGLSKNDIVMRSRGYNSYK